MVIETTDRWVFAVTCVENRDDLFSEGLFNKVMAAIIDTDPESANQIALIQKVVEQHPEVRIIAIIDHGNVDAAVQSMKFGAIEVIQKPVTPQRIAEALDAALAWSETQALDYSVHLSHARRDIAAGHLTSASAHLHIAIAKCPTRPDAFNLLGAIQEIDGNRHDAMRHYRVALDLDPTYAPARYNLLRDMNVHAAVTLDLGQ